MYDQRKVLSLFSVTNAFGGFAQKGIIVSKNKEIHLFGLKEDDLSLGGVN